MICSDADGITIKGLKLITENLPVLRFTNCKNVNIEDLDVKSSAEPIIDIRGNKTGNINIRSADKADKPDASIGNEVDKSKISIL